MDSLTLLSEIQSLEDAILEGIPDIGLRRIPWYAIQRVRAALNDTEMDLIANDERTVENATRSLVNAALVELNGDLTDIAVHAGAAYKKQLRSIKSAFESFKTYPDARKQESVQETVDVERYFAQPAKLETPIQPTVPYDPDDQYKGLAIYIARSPDEADLAVKDIEARRKRIDSGTQLPSDSDPYNVYVPALMERIRNRTHVPSVSIPKAVVAPPPPTPPAPAPPSNDLMAFLLKMDQKMDNMSNQMTQMESRLTERIDAVEQRLDKKIDDVEQRLTERIDAVEQRLTRRIDDTKRYLIHDLDRIGLKVDQLEMHFGAIIGLLGSHAKKPKYVSVRTQPLSYPIFTDRHDIDMSMIAEQRGPPV